MNKIKEFITSLLLVLITVDLKSPLKIRYILNSFFLILAILTNIYFEKFKPVYFFSIFLFIPMYFIYLFTMFRRNGIRLYLIRKFGEEQAYNLNCVFLQFLFFSYGGCLASITMIYKGNYITNEFHIYSKIIGIVLIFIGITAKTISAMNAGRDAYFCKDLFFQKNISSFCNKGIYKYFKNPMYGIGYIQAYGFAIFFESIPGFIASIICQISIYMFYYIIELKHIKENIIPNNCFIEKINFIK